jgi:hypothetical protein
MLRRISAGFVVIGAVLVLAGPVVLAADEGQPIAHTEAHPKGFTLTYDVYTGGLRAIRLDLSVAFAPAGQVDPAPATAYETRINMETSGLIGALFNWRFDANSVGAWQGGNIVPERYHTANVWRGNAREVSIDYVDGVAGKVSAVPPYSAEDMKKVDPAMIPGAIDPTSAVTSLVLTSALEGRCRPRTTIYDGRRRYDANMETLEAEILKPSSAAPFAGKAEGCKLSFKRIAGFKPGKKRLQDFEVDIWQADIGVENGRVPVRLELFTPWGNGFAHLIRARAADGALVFGAPSKD